MFISLLASLIGLYCGTLVADPQLPPDQSVTIATLQSVYVYQGTNTTLLRIRNCENIGNVGNIAYQELENTSKIRCEDERGRNVTINLIHKQNSSLPGVNSTNARYYILRLNETEDADLARGQETRPGDGASGQVPYDVARGEENGMMRTKFPIICWDGKDWKTLLGWMPANFTKICCSKLQQLASSCSEVLYINSSNILEEEQSEIRTGYGFKLNYTTNAWPYHLLRSELRCGNYQCNFTGDKTTSGDCRISYSSRYMSSGPFNRTFLKPPIYRHPRLLQIAVPRLTDQFQGAQNCSLALYLEEELLAGAHVKLFLLNSTAIISSYSDTGLLDLADFRNRDPQCLSDGWNGSNPVAMATWEPSENDDKKDKFNNRGWASRSSKVAEKVYRCQVQGCHGNTCQQPSRWMMFVQSPTTKFSSDKSSSGTTICSTDRDKWAPKPTRFGWTLPDGEDQEKEWDPNLTTVSWEVKLNVSGNYRCWAEVSYTWLRPKQEDVLRKEYVIKSTANSQQSSSSSVTESEQGKTESITKEKKTESTGVDYWYMVGLGILATILAISTALIYKVVKKNQVKVSNLDTKLSLDKVKSKMGINALYSRIVVAEEEPLLSRIPHIHKEHLVTDRILGTGQFGKVLKGTLSVENEDGTTAEIDVAVKCLMHTEHEESTEEFLKEVIMMYQLDHHNVVKLLGICTEYDQYMIVAEFMEHGNLKDFLMTRDPELSLTDKLFLCYQISCGLEHIASQNIVHRDIAARNCLVGPNLLVKVADFGLSRSLAMSNYYKKVGGQVPIRWMSPEAIKYGRYTAESDVWAFGVVMWEVYTEGHFPYSGHSNEEVQNMLDNGFKLHVPPHCTEDISVLMQATWETDPSSRPTFKAIKSRLHQMLRNSDSASSTAQYSSPVTDPQPSTSTDFQDSSCRTLCRDESSYHGNTCSYHDNTRTLCRDVSRSSTPDLASNRYATEPGVSIETTL